MRRQAYQQNLKHKKLLTALIYITFAALLAIGTQATAYAASAAASPLLSVMYNFGGCQDEYYTPEAYYVKPIVKDFTGNGKQEIVFGNYGIMMLDATTGDIIWRVNGGHDRSTPYSLTGGDIGILHTLESADIDGDGRYEIIAGHANGAVSVLSWDGYFKPGWPQQLKKGGHGEPVTARVRSIEVSDLDNDGKCEIIAAASTVESENVWVYSYDGKLMQGWPQLAPSQDALLTHGIDSGYSYGVFMDGVTSGDITGDGMREVIVATDTAYICAYDIKGKLVAANPSVFGGRTWGKVALWEDVRTETNMNFNEGWGSWPLKGTETRSELYKAELGHAVITVEDIDGDGKNEVVTSAVIVDMEQYDTHLQHTTSKYMSFFIFNGDRTRYKGWEASPSDKNHMKPPLIPHGESLVAEVQSVPVVADLNSDGVNEIIINTYDGMIHAFSIDDPTQEFAHFPFMAPQHPGNAETPNGVVCVDIDGDGKLEVIFTTLTSPLPGFEQATVNGHVYILNSDGTLRASHAIPDGYRIYETQKPAYANSTYAAPAVADIDGDGKYEIIVNTKYSGICVLKIDAQYPRKDASLQDAQPPGGAAVMPQGAASSQSTASPEGAVGSAGAAVVAVSSVDLAADIKYSDVAEGEWYYEPVRYAAVNGILSAAGAGIFKPDDALTFGEAVAALHRAGGDQSGDSGDAIVWALENGIIGAAGGAVEIAVGGEPDDEYGGISAASDPTGAVTREQFAAMVYRYAQYMGAELPGGADISARFTDGATTSGWASEAMGRCIGAGLFIGFTDGTLRPGDAATRAQCAVILKRFDEFAALP
ncbi:MAG: FG-GAP-like repeat-containing protein [Oscillospiraceae bacterium]|nr:FG-GAP-like repeat-containing protein [Oscillospiraceae bacterium]